MSEITEKLFIVSCRTSAHAKRPNGEMITLKKSWQVERLRSGREYEITYILDGNVGTSIESYGVKEIIDSYGANLRKHEEGLVRFSDLEKKGNGVFLKEKLVELDELDFEKLSKVISAENALKNALFVRVFPPKLSQIVPPKNAAPTSGVSLKDAFSKLFNNKNGSKIRGIFTTANANDTYGYSLDVSYKRDECAAMIIVGRYYPNDYNKPDRTERKISNCFYFHAKINKQMMFTHFDIAKEEFKDSEHLRSIVDSQQKNEFCHQKILKIDLNLGIKSKEIYSICKTVFPFDSAGDDVLSEFL
ncbi:hypothetical protein FACS1894211_03320 [Clostridia bacterium]|nr:hypothetical protein FACS1894211_03320 [Clostridia bacterium]